MGSSSTLTKELRGGIETTCILHQEPPTSMPRHISFGITKQMGLLPGSTRLCHPLNALRTSTPQSPQHCPPMNHAGEQDMGYGGGSTPSCAVTHYEYVWLVRFENEVRRTRRLDIAHLDYPRVTREPHVSGRLQSGLTTECHCRVCIKLRQVCSEVTVTAKRRLHTHRSTAPVSRLPHFHTCNSTVVCHSIDHTVCI